MSTQTASPAGSAATAVTRFNHSISAAGLLMGAINARIGCGCRVRSQTESRT